MNTMSKVKVWGREISCCRECTQYTKEFYTCQLIGDMDSNEIDTSIEIHKDCPFSKPITKEVIENFGFNYIKTHPGTTESYFELPNSEWGIDFDPVWNGKPFIRIYVFGCDGDTTHFSGVITNPLELKFILKSIGVIE